MSPLARWLTRPSRVPAVLRGSAAVLLGALALVGLTAAPSPGQTQPGSNGGPAAVPAASDRRADRIREHVRRPRRAGGRSGARRPGAGAARVHPPLRGLPPDRGPWRADARGGRPRPVAGDPAAGGRGGPDGALRDAPLRRRA